MEEKDLYSKLYVNGEYFKTKVCSKYQTPFTIPDFDIKNVRAFIPGTIGDIFVKVGDSVKENQDLLILEAMKMRNRVKSPVSGKIKAIHVEKNQIVVKNQILVEIE